MVNVASLSINDEKQNRGELIRVWVSAYFAPAHREQVIVWRWQEGVKGFLSFIGSDGQKDGIASLLPFDGSN